MLESPGFLASRLRRALAAIACAVLATTLAAAFASRAVASTRQVAMFEDITQLFQNPDATLAKLRLLGAQVLRLDVAWANVAPRPLSHQRPNGFNASDPAAYPTGNWSIFDRIVSDAQQNGIEVNMNLRGGAPLWATGPGAPTDSAHSNWEPSPGEFAAFVRAAGTRYSGSYVPDGSSTPLPRVHFWSVWNEPNLGFQMAPQGVPGSLTIENSPHLYRNLLDGAWAGLHQSGHGHDTIVIGELAPRGYDYFGVFSSMKPLVFLRALYCVDSRYRQLRGSAASIRGCPSTASGSRGFRDQHPALFQASAFSDHLYMRWYPPNREAQPDPNYTSLAEMGGLERTLDRVQQIYGSSKRFSIFNTEFGYITAPPNRSPFVSPETAAYYLNWAEYISWRNPRLASFDQYLLRDPTPPNQVDRGWATGLTTPGGFPKATYSAWRLPLYLPSTSARHGHSLEVWGCARPAYFASTDPGGGPQSVQIQFEPRGSNTFTTLRTVPITNRQGYFDVHATFGSSGTVRLTYTYPANDPLLPQNYTAYSRHVQVTIH